jgi:hypothetical protein
VFDDDHQMEQIQQPQHSSIELSLPQLSDKTTSFSQRNQSPNDPVTSKLGAAAHHRTGQSENCSSLNFI